MQWASLSDVPQMDTSPKFGTEQGFNILNTILVTSQKNFRPRPRRLSKFEMAAKMAAIEK